MRRIVPFIAILAACSAGAVDDIHLATDLQVYGPVTAGAAAHAVFRNSFGSAMSVGDLSCGVEIDRLDFVTWVKVSDANRDCALMTGYVVATGDTLAFQFVAPTTPGFYQISSSAGVAGPGQVTLVAYGLLSQTFEVTAAATAP